MSLIDLSYSNEALIDPTYLFGHVRKNSSDLTSMVSVKDICMKNKDAFVAGIISHIAWGQLGNGKEDLYIRGTAWILVVLDDVEKDDGAHCGDCTKVAVSCNICICESIFAEGISNLSYFKDLLEVQNEKIKSQLSKFDNCILFMTICQFEEKYWNDFTNSYKELKIPTYFESLKVFMEMSEDEQNERYDRMKKVREYIENPIPIEGIPWW
jgi:hypothetical protein